MTLAFWEFGQEVLRRHDNNPMHYKDITNEALELGLISDGKTKAQSMRSRMGDHPTIFERVGRGLYRLKEFESVSIIEPNVQSTIDEYESGKVISTELEIPKSEDELVNEILVVLEKYNHRSRHAQEHYYHHILFGHMLDKFDTIDMEEPKGNARPDIVVDKRIAIEVKGPTKEADLMNIYNTKCDKYLRHFDALIVVLFDVDVPERYYNQWLKMMNTNYPEIYIIRKDLIK